MPPLFAQAAVARRLADSFRRCATSLLSPRAALCSVALLLAHQAPAQSVWNTTTGSWSSAGNWSPASVPTSTDPSTALKFGGSSSYTSTNDIGNFALNQLLFNNTAGTITVAGSPATNALDLTNANADRAMLAGITLSGAGSATISSALIFDGETTVTNSGSGTLTLGAGTSTFAFANGTKQTFINNGTGTLTLADTGGGSTYTNSGTNTGLVLNLINNSTTGKFLNIGDMGSLTNTMINVGGTGTVRFSGSAGDLFGGTTVLNVASGATFDFNSNAETFGALSGAGNILMSGTGAGNVGLTVSQVGYFVFSGKLSGTDPNASLTLSGSTQTLVLSGATSDYAGATVIASGRLIVSANAPSGSAGALGNATTDVLVGNTSGSGLARLLMDTAGVSIGRNVRLQSGNTGVITLGGLNATGTVTYAGNVTLGTDNGVAKAVTITSASGGTVEFTGNIQRASGATGSADAVTLIGGGTVAFRGANTYSGATTVSGGTLLLDDTTNNASKLSASAALTLNGGSLTLSGSSAAASSETVAGLTLGNSSGVLGGSARISITSGTNQNATLVLNAITRNTGATANFNPTGTGSGVAAITTTTANNTSVSTGNDAMNILGAYATYKLNDWAVNDGSGNIVALSSGSYGTTFGSGLHTSLSAATTTLAAGGATTNTLRLTGTSAVAFNAGTDTLTLESGGLLVASTAGATSIGTTSKRGVLATSTGELIIHQQSSSTLTINAVISGTNLVKSGDGALVLSATNTYTGNTIVNGGSVSATATGNLGAAAAGITLNGATLIIPSGSISTGISATSHPITIGAAGGTFNFAVVQTVQGAGLSGSGTLTLTGAGGIVVGTSVSTFSGDIVINNGVVRMNSQQFTSVPSITVNSGGTYEVNDDATGTFGANATNGRIIINGNGFGSNGAIRVTDQTPASAFVDPKTTIVNEVAMQSTSRIQVDNGTAIGSLSQLIITGNVTGPGGLDKTGNGVLTLTSRDNTYAGSTLVENGTLRIDLGNDRLPTGTSVTLGTGTTSGVLQLNGFTQSVAGLTTAGTGTANAVIGGSSTSTSLLDVTVASGTQTYGGSLGSGGTAANTVNTAANNNVGFIKDGAGTFVLGGAGTYTGATTVNQGTLMLGNTSALGAGGASLAAGAGGTTVNAGATLDLNGQAGVQEVITLNGTGVGGAGALVNNSSTAASIGSGVASLSFSGVSTTGWSAAAAVAVDPSTGGSAASASAQLGLGTGSLSLTAGGSGYGLAPTVTVNGGSGAVVIASVGVTSASYTVTSNTTTYSVAPTVTLSNGATGVANLDVNGKVVSITVTSAGSNFSGTPTASFSGGTVLSAGTAPTVAGNNSNYTVVGLNIVNPGTGFTAVPTVTISGGTGAAATAVGNDGAFVLNGVTLDASGGGYASAPNVSLSGGTASATANLTSVNLATDSSVGGSGDLKIDATVTGSGALTKVGAGTTTLTGTNTYTGATTVSAGTLQVGVIGIGQSGAGALTVNGPTAVLAGTGSIVGSTTVVSGEIKPGDSGGAATGALNTHSLAFTPVSTSTVAELQITGSTAGANLAADQIHVTGTLTLNSFSNLLVNGSGYTAAVGDTFTLLDWSSVVSLNGFSTGTNLRTGANSAGNEGNLDLPDITGIGLWQISSMLDAGALSLTVVANVPEPTRGVLLLCAALGLALRRRRR
ncbi:beta strand repeat-containing protein [Prosthecobacter vanneervenii]|uniref:Autotransporter-associated beta strand protein n=1 Tax=Prosthecobacter vanneervenii TaxID=48466 RepID=A0A7W8DI15_9BACT|nr:autotransporter-associated beta strand repeat-containing protein [Prosthecobacter vanneervenii]MBB5030542.1 autotransporter-associated beta strand protein [Prosthecobacter vanneervenii]